MEDDPEVIWNLLEEVRAADDAMGCGVFCTFRPDCPRERRRLQQPFRVKRLCHLGLNVRPGCVYTREHILARCKTQRARSSIGIYLANPEYFEPLPAPEEAAKPAPLFALAVSAAMSAAAPRPLAACQANPALEEAAQPAPLFALVASAAASAAAPRPLAARQANPEYFEPLPAPEEAARPAPLFAPAASAAASSAAPRSLAARQARRQISRGRAHRMSGTGDLAASAAASAAAPRPPAARQVGAADDPARRTMGGSASSTARPSPPRERRRPDQHFRVKRFCHLGLNLKLGCVYPRELILALCKTQRARSRIGTFLALPEYFEPQPAPEEPAAPAPPQAPAASTAAPPPPPPANRQADTAPPGRRRTLRLRTAARADGGLRVGGGARGLARGGPRLAGKDTREAAALRDDRVAKALLGPLVVRRSFLKRRRLGEGRPL